MAGTRSGLSAAGKPRRKAFTLVRETAYDVHDAAVPDAVGGMRRQPTLATSPAATDTRTCNSPVSRPFCLGMPSADPTTARLSARG